MFFFVLVKIWRNTLDVVHFESQLYLDGHNDFNVRESYWDLTAGSVL